MEPRFGHDFSQVRVHTDEQAVESAQAVNALAYTVGRDVVFGMGQYAPETRDTRRLLAHELAHVIQQTSGNTGNNLIQRAALASRNLEWNHVGARHFHVGWIHKRNRYGIFEYDNL